MNPNEWIIGGDTGISSKTIWAVMMGSIPNNPSPFQFDTPLDPSDFGRCHRLLVLFPEWRDRLPEVAEVFPKWGPMIREWDKMTALYERDYKSGISTELYKLMQKLVDEGRLAEGGKEICGGCGMEVTGTGYKEFGCWSCGYEP